MHYKIGTPGYLSIWTSKKENGIAYYDNLFYLAKNLVPTIARDWFHSQLYTNLYATQATAGANFMAVSETTTTPDESWTTLTGEITTNNLARKQANPAPTHIVGTNVSIIETTWTPNANFPNVQVLGLFTALSAGVLGHVGRFDQIANVVSGQAFRALATINHG